MSNVSPARTPIDGDTLMRLEDDGGPVVAEHALSHRQCGRCRKLFPSDASLPATAMPDWWLCPRCRTTRLGDLSNPPVVRAKDRS